MNCDQCGKHTPEVWMVLWARDMGKLCRSCFDEISACPPKGPEKKNIPEEEKKAKRLKALEAARAARAAKAKDAAAQKAETAARKRAENPERYDAQLAARREAIKKAQAALATKKELTPEQP